MMAAPYAGSVIQYLGSGLIAARPAAPNLYPGTVGLWWATDTTTLSAWDGSTWTDVSGGGGSTRNAVTAVTPVSGVATLDYSLGDYFTLTLTANVTSWVISNPPGSGKGFSLMVEITQGAGPYTVADPGTAPGGSLTVSTGNGDVDVLAISSFDNGATLRCNLANDYS